MTRLTWVIGGDSGIGLATAQMLASDPRRAVYASSAEQCDVRSPRAIESFWGTLEQYLPEHTAVDVVYSAGVNALDWIGEIDEYDLDHLYQVNVMGFIRVLNCLRGHGIEGVRLVAVGSDAATRPLRTSMVYCSSKAALHAAVAVAARELGGVGWRVNCVAPGMTSDTGMTAYIDARVPQVRGWSPEETYGYELQQAVIKRRALPAEVAGAVQMLLDGPDYINGAILAVNGGR